MLCFMEETHVISGENLALKRLAGEDTYSSD